MGTLKVLSISEYCSSQCGIQASPWHIHLLLQQCTLNSGKELLSAGYVGKNGTITQNKDADAVNSTCCIKERAWSPCILCCIKERAWSPCILCSFS